MVNRFPLLLQPPRTYDYCAYTAPTPGFISTVPPSIILFAEREGTEVFRLTKFRKVEKKGNFGRADPKRRWKRSLFVRWSETRWEGGQGHMDTGNRGRGGGRHPSCQRPRIPVGFAGVRVDGARGVWARWGDPVLDWRSSDRCLHQSHRGIAPHLVEQIPTAVPADGAERAKIAGTPGPRGPPELGVAPGTRGRPDLFPDRQDAVRVFGLDGLSDRDLTGIPKKKCTWNSAL